MMTLQVGVGWIDHQALVEVTFYSEPNYSFGWSNHWHTNGTKSSTPKKTWTPEKSCPTTLH